MRSGIGLPLGFLRWIRLASLEASCAHLSLPRRSDRTPRRPSSTMRILSSAEKCRRVCRRMSFTTRSAGAFVGDFALEDLGFILWDGRLPQSGQACCHSDREEEFISCKCWRSIWASNPFISMGSTLLRIAKHDDQRSKWAQELQSRAGHNKPLVAMANKTARMVWAMLRSGESYKMI